MPKVTVILPHYKQQAYLADAVQSITDQTFKDWELIIMNDEPEINNRVWYYEKFNSRIRVYTSDVHMDQAFQLNEGVRLAKGEYIAFQDADDLSFSYRLAISALYLDEGFDLVYGDKIFLYPDKQEYWESPEWDKTKLHLRPMGCWGSYMVKTDIARKAMFDPNIKWGNDHIFEAKISVLTDKICRIPLPFYKQRTYSTTYRNCRIPIYRKIKRLRTQKKINRQVREIVNGKS
jgi:glycosyltransferase involved in cell wall biosynthesis